MRRSCAVVVAVVLSSALTAHAAKPPKSPARVPPGAKDSTPATTVDLFAAEEAGQIEVRVIPRDEKQARIIIANKTNEPLRVKFPEHWAAVPILAQFNLGPNNNNQQQTQQQPQAVGGPGGANMQQRLNQQPGIFNIPAEQTRDVKVVSVCLEYGKPTPRSAMAYKLVPLSTVSTRPELVAVFKEYGEGRISQKVAQAATWNITSGMTWDELRKEKGEMVAATVFEPYFTKQELDEARQLVEKAASKASPATDSSPSTKSPGESIKP